MPLAQFEPKKIYIRVEATPVGIYWSSSLGLITIADGAGNDITIADKNLGATTVYNSGDTLSEANCGKYYQWGNNYGFPFTGTVYTSSTKVNASTYGPGNYYSSSTFIIPSSPFDRSNIQNDNLWGDTTDTLTARKGPCDEGYHVPTKDELVALCGLLTNTFGLSGNSTTMGTYLKMPMNGTRPFTTGEAGSQGTYGTYWSSTPNATYQAYYMYFSTSELTPSAGNASRANGTGIRPFKNDAVQPDDTRTVLYQPS